MEAHNCPECGDENHPKGVVNLIREFRCTGCGMIYYTPEGCRTPPSEGDPVEWARQQEKMRLPSEHA